MHLKGVRRLVIGVLLITLIGFSAQLTPAKSTSVLETIAGKNFPPAVRAAAAKVLAERDKDLSCDELEAIAGDIYKTKELREAYGAVLEKCWAKGVADEVVDIATLEDKAVNGATSEVRAATGKGLFAAYGICVAVDECELETLAESVSTASSDDLAFARALTVGVILRDELFEGNPDDILERAESIANGETRELGGIAIDGSLEAWRYGIGAGYLAGWYSEFGQLAPGEPLESALEERAISGCVVKEEGGCYIEACDDLLHWARYAAAHVLIALGNDQASPPIPACEGKDEAALLAVADAKDQSPEKRTEAAICLGLKWKTKCEKGELKPSDIPGCENRYYLEDALVCFAAAGMNEPKGLAAIEPLACVYEQNDP